MSQHIEFFLHPPSPVSSATSPPSQPSAPATIHSHCTLLPPVSALFDQKDDDPSYDLPTLCLPSPSLSSSSLLEPVEPYSSTLNDNSPMLSPFMGSLSLDSPPQLSPQTSPYPAYQFLLPPPTDTRRCRSLSNASTSSSFSINSESSSIQKTCEQDSPIYHTKRKRGRPPNTSRRSSQRDSWTFVTPTVWDVKHHQEEISRDQHSLESPQSNSDDLMVLHWPALATSTCTTTTTNNNNNHINATKDESQQQQGQNTFTNTTMDTALSMPKKKRGRKPKMQLAGNFCFVWRDLTARRGANKKKSDKIKG